LNPPSIKGFKPYGLDSEGTAAEPVTVLFEEYEALRLSDYDSLNHHQASVMMGVSRPTFTRIYASALQKIAVAFVEGRQITIEGGKFILIANGIIVTLVAAILTTHIRTSQMKCVLCVAVRRLWILISLKVISSSTWRICVFVPGAILSRLTSRDNHVKNKFVLNAVTI